MVSRTGNSAMGGGTFASWIFSVDAHCQLRKLQSMWRLFWRAMCYWQHPFFRFGGKGVGRNDLFTIVDTTFFGRGGKHGNKSNIFLRLVRRGSTMSGRSTSWGWHVFKVVEGVVMRWNESIQKSKKNVHGHRWGIIKAQTWQEKWEKLCQIWALNSRWGIMKVQF